MIPTTALVISNLQAFDKINMKNKKAPYIRELFIYESVCKPGSVLNDHLSSPAVADRIKPPPENSRAGYAFSHGVAPDRVYSINVSPRDE